MTGSELKKRLNRILGDNDELIIQKSHGLIKPKKLFGKREITVSDLENVSVVLNLPISSLLEKVDDETIGDIWVSTEPFKLPVYQSDLNFMMKKDEMLEYFVAVFIDESNCIKVFTPENISEFRNYDEGDYVYFFFRRKNQCEIRHLNKNKDLNIEFIGEDGYRIFVDDRRDLHIKLYKNNDCKLDKKVNSIDNFGEMILSFFEDYLDRIKQ